MAWKETENGSAMHRRHVGDAVGHRDEHRVVGRHQLGPGPGRPGDHADVDAGADVALGERPAHVDVAGRARRAERGDAPGGAAQPRVEHHPLAHLEAPGLRAEGHDLGHHLVAGDVGEGGEGGHRVVDVAVGEVAQHQLGVGAAHPRQDRPGHHPVGVDGAGVVHVVEAEGHGEPGGLQVVRRGPAGARRGSGLDPNTSAFTTPPAPVRLASMARMPATNPSKSLSFISTTARMSGT